MSLSKYFIPNSRKNYLLYFEIGLILSLTTFIGLFNLPMPDHSPDDSMWDIPEKEILHLETIIPTKQEPPKPVSPPDAYVPNHPPEDKIIEEKLQYLDIEFSHDEPLPVPTENLQTAQKYFEVNQQSPQLVGGIEKLQRQIEYPPRAVKDNVEGRVIVMFYIDKKGKVHKPKIIKGIRSDIDREALEAISKAEFLPARKRGKPIPVEHLIHILFKLEKS